MGKVRRIRVRAIRRKHPDAALVAQAIIQLGRELWAAEQAKQQSVTPSSGRPDSQQSDEATS
jgi:hypothetical protein